MSDMTDKIAALLRKAERTTNEHEAEAFFTKAQELAAKHAIDLMVARQRMHEGEADPLGSLGRTTVKLGSSYERADITLLHVIAEVNDCKAVWMRGMKMGALYGYETDRVNVELLYTSLLMHVSREALAYGRQSHLKGMELYVARRTFREAFADRIGTRLKEARRTAVQAYEAQGSPLAPMLLSKRDAVDRIVGGTTKGRAAKTRWDYQAAGAGRTAAERADIGGPRLGAVPKGAIER